MLKILKIYDNPQTDENAKTTTVIDGGEADLADVNKDLETDSLLEHKNDSNENIENTSKDIDGDS